MMKTKAEIRQKEKRVILALSAEGFDGSATRLRQCSQGEVIF